MAEKDLKEKDKSKVTDNAEGTGTTPETADDNKVTISKSELQDVISSARQALDAAKESTSAVNLMREENNALRQELAELRTNGVSDPNRPANVLKKITQRFVNIKVYDGKPVIGFINKSNHPRIKLYVYKDIDPANPLTKIEYIDLIVKGEEEPIKMPYLDYIKEVPTMRGLVVKEIPKPETESLGYVEKIELKDYNQFSTGVYVENEVLYVGREYEIKLENDEVITVSENLVNN